MDNARENRIRKIHTPAEDPLETERTRMSMGSNN